MKVKQLGRRFCILVIHLKEISNLEQHNIIRVVVLDVVVGVKVTSELSLPCLHFFIPGFLFWRKISVVSDDILKAGEHLVPVQFYIGTIWLLQLNTFTGAVNPASSRYCMGATADTVLVL